MSIKQSHIFEVRQLSNKDIVLCYINIESRSVKYYSGQSCSHETQRWMQTEHWASFDTQVEALLETLVDDRVSKVEERSFQLDELVAVNVKNSPIPISSLKQCLTDANNWNILCALDFFIHHKGNSDKVLSPKKSLVQLVLNHDANHNECEPVSVIGYYTPYTSTVKPLVVNKKDDVEPVAGEEEPSSPKPLIADPQIDNDETSSIIPIYKPARKRKIKKISVDETLATETIEYKTKKSRSKKIAENDENPCLVKDTFPPLSDSNQLSSSFSRKMETGRVSSKKKSSSKSATKSHRNLFGSDNDGSNERKVGGHEGKVKRTGKKSAHCTPTDDCSKERQAIDDWLNKKLSKKLLSTELSHDESVELPTTVAKITKDDIKKKLLKEDQEIEMNIKVLQDKEKLEGQPPKKIATLTIKDLTLYDIQNSFEKHKPKMDEIFSKYANSANIQGYNGVNHYLVMDLLDESNTLEIMHRLQKEYEPHSEGPSSHALLFAHAMMPEWIIRLFMEKHNMSRDEAIQHVKDQEAYNIYMGLQN